MANVSAANSRAGDRKGLLHLWASLAPVDGAASNRVGELRCSAGPGQANTLGSGVGVASRRFCTVNIVMTDGVVNRVNYVGPTGGLLTSGERAPLPYRIACNRPTLPSASYGGKRRPPFVGLAVARHDAFLPAAFPLRDRTKDYCRSRQGRQRPFLP